MRGKLTRQRVVAEAFRITPADAGKTVRRICREPLHRDHPRGCGENANHMCIVCLPAGITPADAGKTAYPPLYTANIWDHPRGCGENLRDWVARNAAAGSPPRMRGKRKTARAHSGRFGITPADAGKTPVLRNDLQNARDHPRGCGENVQKVFPIFPISGSPPRMRGKRRRLCRLCRSKRITPADAGKTL